jgi:hypothetical protein
MPPASEWRTAAIAKGQADWPPFRDPTTQPPHSAAESDDTEGEEATGELETEIRELIAEYNEVVADGTVEELLDYFVEAQHEKLSPILALTIQYRDAQNGLRAALESKLPGDQERIARALRKLAAGLGGGIEDVEIKVVGDSEVTATSTIVEYRFALIDEDWFFELSQLDQYAAAQTPRLERAMASMSGWLSALESDQSKPDAVLEQIELAAEARVETQPPVVHDTENTPGGSEKPEEGDDHEGG